MKELKDYLHLYIGCEVMLNISYPTSARWVNGRLVGVEETTYMARLRSVDGEEWGTLHTCYPRDIKPILRPLSDMTDKERVTLEHLADELTEDIITPLEIDAAITNQCRKWEIDVDGLLRAGLALDKTKLSNSCDKSCSPSDYYKGGKCDLNGCFEENSSNEQLSGTDQVCGKTEAEIKQRESSEKFDESLLKEKTPTFENERATSTTLSNNGHT